MAVEMDMLEHVMDLLGTGDTRAVKSLVMEDTFQRALQERASDLIPSLSFYVNDDVMKNKPGVSRCVEKLLFQCVEKGNPKECLMELLAQVETLDEVKFQVLLKPIQIAMLRVPNRKAPLMQCVFHVVHSFINTLPLPEYTHVDNKSKLLLDCDENVRRITDMYNLIVSFYEPFVDEFKLKLDASLSRDRIRLVLLQALFHLLGVPLVYLDLENNENESESAHKRIASKIISYILILQPDPLNLLTLIEEKYTVTVEEEKTIVKEFSSNEIKYSDLSLSVFFYLILSDNLAVPCVYERQFVFLNCLTSATTLLQFKATLVLRKGLLLIKRVLASVEPGSVPFSHLSSDVPKRMIECLSNVAIYEEVKENRKLAIDLLKQYLLALEPKAQFYTLLYSAEKIKHPNIIGFFTTMLTGFVKESFSNDQHKIYFMGKKLSDLMSVYCSLSKGAETDLIENKEQILSALNLIIFLTIRDKEDISGVWRHIPILAQNFLDPLREGIKLSRAHYQLEIQKMRDPLTTDDGSDLSVTVAGQCLGAMSAEEKEAVIKSGLTIFDLMEHLLCRTDDCIANKSL